MMNNILDYALMEKHVGDIFPDITTEKPYASLKIKAGKYQMIQEPIFFHFMIDRSGSMSDKCKDGKSKMDHIIHTLTNMLYFFADNNTSNIYCQITSFDTIIENIFEPIQITKQNVKEIIKKLDNIFPRNSTNIELALKYSKMQIQEYSEFNSTHHISHIFMTDGDSTSGNSNEKYLASLVSPTISSSYIAFGVDHNAKIMNKLGNVGKKSSHWFIDKLENAGLVYGEILNNELYIGAEEVIITMTNGLIYNYQLGKFVDYLEINTLVTETEKNYHIISDDLDNCIATICGKYIENGEEFEEIVYMLPDLIDIYTQLIIPNDLTSQIFRLHTQQLMYEVSQCNNNNIEIDDSCIIPCLKRTNTIISTNVFNNIYDQNLLLPIVSALETVDELDNKIKKVNKIEIKKKIVSFQKTILDYMKNNQLENDELMKNLCDDIHITVHTLGTNYQQMYVNARQTSQGRQQTYNVTDIELVDDDDNDNDFPITLAPYKVKRSSTNTLYSTPTAIKTMNTISSTLEDENI